MICRIGGRWGQGDVYFSLYSQELGLLLFESRVKHHFPLDGLSWLAVSAWFHTVSAWCGWWMGVTYCTRRQSWQCLPGSTQSLHGVGGGWGYLTAKKAKLAVSAWPHSPCMVWVVDGGNLTAQEGKAGCVCLVPHSLCMVWVVDGGTLLQRRQSWLCAWFHTVPVWCGW